MIPMATTSVNQLTTRPQSGIARSILAVPTVVWIVLAEIIFFAIFAEGFTRPANLLSITIQAAPLVILSMGAGIILISDGLDLSSGMVFTLVMSVSAILLRAGLFWPIALLCGLLVGLVAGLANGLLVARLNLPPFLATLGTMGIAWGIGLGITELSSVAVPAGPTYFIGEGTILHVPMPVIIALLTFVVSHILIYRTPFGNYLYAIGSNKEAAELSGVHIVKWTTLIWVYAGFLAGITGIVLLGRMHASHPNVGFGWEFDAVAAAVIGGISIGGGRGKLYTAIFGALFIAVIRNGMNFMGLDVYWQTLIKGLVIVGAIVIDLVLEQRRNSAG
jgi:ribose/xylose/arabinose/galactoside ABC-type transport system permease subunit